MVACLATLGVVFGDIGTSPLYAFRECFAGSHAAPAHPENLIGAASLIVWSLLLIVSVKYLAFILRLDNRGEGGILALSALIRGASTRLGRQASAGILLCGLAGSALIYADGMLTPAISVLSALEGLAVSEPIKHLGLSAPVISEWVVTLSVVILIGLFFIQRFGTGKVGVLFGPIVLLWFLTLGTLGLFALAKHPQVIIGLSPHAAVSFMIHEWKHAFPLLAAVFLAVTGGEALYADLGHFGARAIRVAWFAVVLPCLVINYLGQAALLTEQPDAIESPFFLMAPAALRFPLTMLATAAAVIASQALISGAFSLTVQAIQLGCLPRMKIRHTSEHSMGQVYVPMINWGLAFACCLLVITFKSSSALAGAYGIAIALTMTITTLLFFRAARDVWGWSRTKAIVVTGLFLLIDGAFLAANSTKIPHWGFLPLIIGGAILMLMMVWLWGRQRLMARFAKEAIPVDLLLSDLHKGRIHRVSGTAVYMSGKGRQLPTALMHNLKHNQVLHEQVLLLHVMTLDQPHLDPTNSLTVEEVGEGIHQVVLRFGFADSPDVPAALKELLPDSIRFQPGKTTYFLGSESYRVGKMATVYDRVRLFLFAIMARNASSATAYFNLPPGRVVELGAQITL